MPTRSVFFFWRFQIIDGDRSAFALAQGVAGPAPGARSLVTITCLPQHLADRLATDVRKIRLPENPLQQCQRPCCRLVLFAIGLPLEFSQHALPLLARVRRLATSPRCCLQDGKSTLVKAENHLRDCFPAQPRFLPRRCERRSRCHCQQGFGSFHGIQTLTRRFHHSGQFFLLFFLQLSECFFSWSSHCWFLPASFSPSLPLAFPFCNPFVS